MEELDLLNELSPKSDGNTTYNDDYNTLSVNKAFSSSRSSLNAGSEYSDDFNSFINDSEGFTSFISSGYGTRPSSTGPTSDPNEIINSLHLDMPELTPILSSNSPQKRSSRASSAVAPPKMTDLGFKMSKMIMSTTRKQDDANEEEYDDDESQINSGDSLVDNYGQAKKRQRTGKRGRPKGSTKVGTQFGRASSTHAMPPNVSALMGQANVAYVQKHYSKAIELYLQVVQRAPASPEPYYSLGLVYDEQDNADKAASYFLIAAHMQPRAEGELWRRIAALLVRVVPPRKDQAVYCLTRAIKASKPANYRIHDDLPIYWLRAKLQLEIGEYRSAITGFASALRLHLALESEDMSPFVLVARLAVRMSLSYVAVGVFENVFRSAVSAALPLSWSHLNILVELAEVDKDYSSIVSSIEEFSVSCYLQSGREQGRTDWMLKTAAEQLKKALESDDMPVELKLKYAIAQIHINSSGVSNAENLLTLLGQIEDGCSLSLKESVSEALIILNAPIPALKLLLELIEEDAKLATPEMCLKIGQCYRKAGELEMAVESFLAVLHVNPEHRETRLALSEAYRSLGKVEQALQVLPSSEVSLQVNVVAGKEEEEEFINWDGLNDLFTKVIGVGIEIESGSGNEDDQDEEEDLCEEDSVYIEGSEGASETRQRPKLRFGPERQRRLNRSKRPVLRELSTQQKAALRQNYDALMQQNDLQAADDILKTFSDSTEHFRESSKAPVNSGKRRTIHGLDDEEWSRGLLKVICLQAADCCRRNAMGVEWDRLIRILKTILALKMKENSLQWRVLGLLLAGRANRWDFAIECIKYLIANGSSTMVFLLPGVYMHRSSEFLTAFYHPVAFRFLGRLNARIRRSNPGLLVVLGHQSLATHNYEEAARLYFEAARLEPRWRFLKLCLGNALLSRSLQRTCSNQLARLLQALTYFVQYHREGSGNDAQDDFNLARAFHQIGFMQEAIKFYTRCINNSTSSSTRSIQSLAKYNLSRLYLHCGSPGMARLVLSS